MSFLTPLSDKRQQNPILSDLGFDSYGIREPIPSSLDMEITNIKQAIPDIGINGAKIEDLSVSRLTAGTLKIQTYVQSTGYVAGTTGWRIDGAGNAEFASITLSGGVIKYNKTSFSDSTHSGYYISSDGIYFGQAADATKLKFDIAGGTLDVVGTVSGRATSILASSINASGNLVSDIVNARLDSSAKNILAGFNFGSSDYSGAVNAGNVTWNTTTGAITGGSGVVLYRGGIVGVASGVTKFSIDATTGSATFAGTLSAPTGTLGALTIASGGSIRQGQTAYNTGTGFWLGDVSGTAKFSIGSGAVDNSLTWDGSVLTVNGSAITNNQIFGSGEDGDATLSGGTTTLTKDMFYNNLTLSSSAILVSSGYRIFVKQTLTIDSGCKIHWNGNNGGNGTYTGSYSPATAAGGTGGAALTSGSLYGSVAGKDGGTGAGPVSSGGFGGNGVGGGSGVAGANVTNSFQTSFTGTSGTGGNGGNAGNGSNPNGFTGGSGAGSGAVGTLSSSYVRPFCAQFAVEMIDKFPGASLAYLTYNAGYGGGGGAGSGAAGYYAGYGQASSGGGGSGGGSGSGGGTVVIAARTIVNNGSIESVGGNGGNGGNGQNGASGNNNIPNGGGGGGGGGGGRGGPGGVIVLIYSSLTGSGTTSVAGGASGTGGTAGSGGAQGTGLPADLATGKSDGQAGTAGTTPSQASSGKIISLVV